MCLLCKVMRVSRSGYYFWKTRSKSNRQQEEERMIPKIREIHRQAKASYGAQRMSAELESQCESCGRTKATTLMKIAGVVAKLQSNNRQHP